MACQQLIWSIGQRSYSSQAGNAPTDSNALGVGKHSSGAAELFPVLRVARLVLIAQQKSCWVSQRSRGVKESGAQRRRHCSYGFQGAFAQEAGMLPLAGPSWRRSLSSAPCFVEKAKHFLVHDIFDISSQP